MDSTSTNDQSGTYVSIDVNIQVTPNQSPVVVAPTPVVTPAKFTFTKSLNTGSTGEEVKELQKVLKEKGFYSGPITGTFGPLTKAAVKKFQKAHKISQLGNVGPGTRAELNK
jgi:peptidoglycan hydrolase-like protein with peptidoglycan-binding domain